jgi:hypothetical protein
MVIKKLIVAIIIGLFLLQGYSLVHYLQEERYLAGLMDDIAPRSLPPSEQAIKVAEYANQLLAIQNHSYFLSPIFSFLRPTPRQVIEQGGDCGDKSRLVIRMLRLHEIEATKWALYTQDFRSVHAVVELKAETGKMVVDPDYGLWYPRPGGGYYEIKELRQSHSILDDRVQSLLHNGTHRRLSLLSSYPLDEYTYKYVKSINWEKWVGLYVFYDGLKLVVGSAIDDLNRPSFVEAPQLMVVMMAGSMQGGLVILYLAHSRAIRTKRRSSVEVFT